MQKNACEFAVRPAATRVVQLFSSDMRLVKTGDNFAVGGVNRWKYESIVNWEFFPSEALPILVYFKEIQVLDGIPAQTYPCLRFPSRTP